MMKHINKTIGIFISVAVLATTITAFTGCQKKTEEAKSTVVVGSKNFTEEYVVSELYALALENAGYKIERKYNIPDSTIQEAIKSNQIDLYPEYTGTALMSVLKLPSESDPKAVYDKVKSAYASNFNIEWLNPTPANDSQGIAISTEASQKYGITNMTELQQKASDIRFASQGQFNERADGLPGLATVYGEFKFKSSTVYDSSLLYTVLRNNEADAIYTATTDGNLTDKKFILIKDDKQFFPPYNLAPIVRSSVLKSNPSISNILNAVSTKLTTEELVSLNSKVDIEKKDYTIVAKEYFDSIKADIPTK